MDNATPDGMFALLVELSPSQTIERNLQPIKRMLGAARRDGHAAHVARIRSHLKRLAHYRKAGAIDTAIAEAMSLASAFERLRADGAFSRPIDAYRRSRRRSVITDDEISNAAASYEKQVHAAEHLGISTRQLRDRLARIEKRKSDRLPPR